MIGVAEKLAHLEAYDEAIQTHEGGAYLRANGLYSSQIIQWRKQRDAGLFDGKQPGEAIGQPSKEQAEIARLKRQLVQQQRELEPPRRRWTLWEKRTHSWSNSPRARTLKIPSATTAYRQLVAAKVPSRQAEALTGVSRSRMYRAAVAHARGGTRDKHPQPRPESANKLSDAEREQVLAVLHSDRFVDQARSRSMPGSCLKTCICVRWP